MSASEIAEELSMLSLRQRRIIFAAITSILLAGTIGFAQTSALSGSPLSKTPPPISLRGDRLTGVVTAVDSVKHTVTLTTRYGHASKTIILLPDATIYITRRGSLSDLQIGQTLRAAGSGATPETPTLTATRISQEPASVTLKRKAKAGFTKKGVEGIVLTVSPLTLKTPGGVTVTVNTSPSTKVATLVPGTLADVTTGSTIDAKVSGTDAAPVTSELRVMPGRGGGRKGHSHRRKETFSEDAAPSDPVTPS